MDEDEARSLLGAARVARLATHGPAGRIDLVPITFALLDDGRIATTVDHKPKTTTRLQRLADIAADPRIAVLVDHWDDADWSALWWVRVQGTAEVLEPGAPGHAVAVDAVVARYAQYHQVRPAGAAIVISPERWTGWRAQG